MIQNRFVLYLFLILLAAAIIKIPAFAQGTGPSSSGNKPETETTDNDSGNKPRSQLSGRIGTSGNQRTIQSAFTNEKSFLLWLETSEEGRPFASIRERLVTLLRISFEAGVPPDAFFTRIREAVAKGADPETILNAMEIDTNNWIWLSGILKNGNWPPAAVAGNFYIAVSSAFRNGVNKETIRELAEWSRDSKVKAEKAGAALTAAASVFAIFNLNKNYDGSENPSSIAIILLKSRLQVRQYYELAGLAQKAYTNNYDIDQFMVIFKNVIQKGGTFNDLSRSFFP